MSHDAERSKTTVQELATRLRNELSPLTGKFSYFSTLPIADEDLRHYLGDPIAAISPAVIGLLPPVGILLAPFLEKGQGKDGDHVAFDRPSDGRQIFASRVDLEGMAILAFGAKDVEVADYHYHFYTTLASLVTDRWPEETQEKFYRAIREELGAEVHGEVDERSWRLKQALLRRQTNVRKETKLFRDYARQAFEDTLTLYLHGACCDIDVETGPRQMPSRYLRKRIELMMSLFPPPEGYAILPEQLKAR